MARRTSPRVAQSKGCVPLFKMYTEAAASQARRWQDVEVPFFEAMWAFDENLVTGVADQGDNQNGKGDFFTDLTALLLENCSGKSLHGRGAVPGLIFPRHDLDASYPAQGVVEVLVETKVVGAPKTSRNPSQKNPLGRPGAADLDKRIKEAAFKTIDLKAECARNAAQGEGPTSDLTTWLRRSKPLCFLLIAARVVDYNDLARCIYFANAANQGMDAVGLVAYQPGSSGYRPMKVDPHLELDRVLHRVCTALKNLP